LAHTSSFDKLRTLTIVNIVETRVLRQQEIFIDPI